jgi:hypothetical protein
MQTVPQANVGTRSAVLVRQVSVLEEIIIQKLLHFINLRELALKESP